jgi:DNA-binding CsgD family transcriptional regulator
MGRSVPGILSSREGALMPRRSPYRIELSHEERAVLESLARFYTLPYWLVIRARTVLMAAEGVRNDEIAARLGCGRDVVSQWRFLSSAWPGSRIGPDAADRRLFPPRVRAEVIRLACERPNDSDVPLARWSSCELAREAIARGIAEHISGVTVWRWLSEDAIKPWQHRSWIFPRDPDFAAKAGASWTSTPAAGKANGYTPATTSSAPTRSPRSKRAPASTPPCRPRPAWHEASASSTSTSAWARSVTWPPGTPAAPSFARDALDETALDGPARRFAPRADLELAVDGS